MSWNKDYRSILLLIGSIITILFVYSESLMNVDLTANEKLNLLVFSYTGLVVAWYTKETFDLKIQGIKTLRSSIQPIVTAYKAGPYLVLKNVGRGIAKNVRWESIDKSIEIISSSDNFPGILEPFLGVIREEKNLIGGDLIAYKVSFTGVGKVRVVYENDRDDVYYSIIEVKNEERVRLISTGSSKD